MHLRVENNSINEGRWMFNKQENIIRLFTSEVHSYYKLLLGCIKSIFVFYKLSLKIIKQIEMNVIRENFIVWNILLYDTIIMIEWKLLLYNKMIKNILLSYNASWLSLKFCNILSCPDTLQMGKRPKNSRF